MTASERLMLIMFVRQLNAMIDEHGADYDAICREVQPRLCEGIKAQQVMACLHLMILIGVKGGTGDSTGD